ncbi:SOS response-associated peptidase family protein [Erwinia sp. V90_4]|uniref:SOS response-associated peptidase family protein n=1 Tax=Erwinia TaxID=551 RepID=UPI00249DE679|nr:SOS response-associated peptidase family protein [Erwinia sp. V90_4]MDI3438811.1 SOS response-associated peptidase family protein [Erwinia sp. V90_4]
MAKHIALSDQQLLDRLEKSPQLRLATSFYSLEQAEPFNRRSPLCGRFTHYRATEEFLNKLTGHHDQNIIYDSKPIARYNVAQGTCILLLNQRDNKPHLDPVHWGYAPGWWDKQPPINACVNTAATSRMLMPLWNHGHVIIIVYGEYGWKKLEGSRESALLHLP